MANLVSIARANAEGSGKQQGQGDDYAFEDKGGAVDGVAEEGKADGAEDVAKKAEGGDGTVDKVEVDARALAEKASERELLELLEQVSDSVQAVDASISSRTGCPGTEGPCTDLEHMPTSALQQRYRALFGTCPASMSRRQVVKKLQGVDDEVLTAALTVSQEPSPKRHHHSPKILFSSIGKHDLARRRKGIKCAGVVSGSPLGKAHRQIGLALLLLSHSLTLSPLPINRAGHWGQRWRQNSAPRSRTLCAPPLIGAIELPTEG